jgi:hypothetical protein
MAKNKKQKFRKARTIKSQTESKVRDGTKQAKMIAMLRRPEGATIDQIVKAFAWQPQTVRGAIAGALKKKLGLAVSSEKTEDGPRVYRVA